MTELLAVLKEHEYLGVIVLFGTLFILWTLAESIGTIGRRTQTTHIHHHHGDGCRREHEKGPCRSE